LREPKTSTLLGVVVLALAAGLLVKASGRGFVNGDLAGAGFQLSSLHGKPVLLEIGATWCGPCRALLRPLRKVQTELAERHLEVITIDVGESREAVQAHYAKRELGGVHVVLDPESRTANTWGIESLPTLVLVDAGGIVRLIRVGAVMDADALKERIRKELGP
jgi:thiol-disulfide isomerase/thioredoxin